MHASSCNPQTTSHRATLAECMRLASASTTDNPSDTCGAESHKQEPAALLLGIAPGEPHSPPFVGGPSAPAEGLPIRTSDGDSARAVVMRGIWRPDRWIRTTHRHSKTRTGAQMAASVHLLPSVVGLASAGSTVQELQRPGHLVTLRNATGKRGSCTVEMFFTNRTSSQELPIERAMSGTTNVDRGVALRIGRGVASQRISPIGSAQTVSPFVSAGAVRSEAACFMPPTIAGFPHCEFSRKGNAPAMTNTARMTSKHMDTMEALLESIERCVGTGTIHDIEEAQMLRLARQATDESQLLDYAFAFSSLALKDNGVFGQRFHQLFREADAYRIGMAEREARHMATAQSVSADQAA